VTVVLPDIPCLLPHSQVRTHFKSSLKELEQPIIQPLVCGQFFFFYRQAPGEIRPCSIGSLVSISEINVSREAVKTSRSLLDFLRYFALFSRLKELKKKEFSQSTI